MSYSPISFIASNYRDYGGHWLKAYEAGTTTAIAMSNDADGTTLTAKYELNSDGFIVSSGSTIVIPHIDSATTYDLWLFPTEDAANNNDTSNAIRVADGITTVSEIEVSNYTGIVFNTVYDAITGTLPSGETITLKAGDRITTNDYRSSQRGGGADYLVKTLTQANDDDDVIDGNINIDISGGLYIVIQPSCGVLSADQAGVTMTGDSTSRYQSFFSYLANKNVKGLGVPGFSSDISSTLLTSALGVDFDGRGCEFNKKFNGNLLNLENPLSNQISASLSVAEVNLDDGTTFSDSYCAIVTVSSTSGYSVNDVVKIFSDDSIEGEDPSNNNYNGEFATVALVSSTTLTLYSTLRNEYTTNVKVARLVKEPIVKLNNFTINGDDFDVSWAIPNLNIVGHYKPEVKNVIGENLPSTLLRLISCYKPVSDKVSGVNVRTSIANNAFGYVIHESGCESGRHHRPAGENVRHVWTCSARESDSGLAQDYGDNFMTRVYFGDAKNCQSTGFDTHPDAVNVRFIGCTVNEPYWGVNGSFTNFGFRGKNCGADNCSSVGGRGFRAFSDYSSNKNSINHTLNNCTHTVLPDDPQDVSSFSVLGSDSSYVTMTVNSPTVIDEHRDKPKFEATHGRLTVVSPTVVNKGAGSATSRVFEANTNGTIMSNGGVIDAEGATSTDTKLATITSTGATIDIRDIKLKDGDYSALIDFNNNIGTFSGRNINITDEKLTNYK